MAVTELHDKVGFCERCGVYLPFEALRWIRRRPNEDSVPNTMVCGRCEDRLHCDQCEGRGCVWCGKRDARTRRHVARREARAIRKQLVRDVPQRNFEGSDGGPLPSSVGYLRAVLRATCASCDGEGFIGPRGTPCPDCSWTRT